MRDSVVLPVGRRTGLGQGAVRKAKLSRAALGDSVGSVPV
jgi:hypothetical protein